MTGNSNAGNEAVILRAGAVDAEDLLQPEPSLARERLQLCCRRLGATLARYHGRLRETRDDGVVAEFDDASHAVCAALAFQATQSEYLNLIEDGIEPRFRIVIFYGEASTQSPSIQSASAPDGVFVARAVRVALPESLPIAYALDGQTDGQADDLFGISLLPGASVPTPGRPTKRKSPHPVSTMRLLNRWLLLAIGAALLFAFLSGT